MYCIVLGASHSHNSTQVACMSYYLTSYLFKYLYFYLLEWTSGPSCSLLHRDGVESGSGASLKNRLSFPLDVSLLLFTRILLHRSPELMDPILCLSLLWYFGVVVVSLSNINYHYTSISILYLNTAEMSPLLVPHCMLPILVILLPWWLLHHHVSGTLKRENTVFLVTCNQ